MWYQILLFALCLCVVFLSRALTTCIGREKEIERERERTTGVMSLSELIFYHSPGFLLFSLGLCLVFHSHAPTTCSGRDREKTTSVIERTTGVISWSRLVFHILMVPDFIICLGSLFGFFFLAYNHC